MFKNIIASAALAITCVATPAMAAAVHDANLFTSNTLAANGYTSTFRLSRSNVDLADLTGYSKNELKRGVIGIDGDFEQAAGARLAWQVGSPLQVAGTAALAQDLAKRFTGTP